MITAKALAGTETQHATQTGSCPRPPNSAKNSKWKRWMVSDEDSMNVSIPQRRRKMPAPNIVRKRKALQWRLKKCTILKISQTAS